MKRDTRIIWRRVRQFTSTFQAELRGHYSSERMRNLLHYSRTTPSLRAVFISAISPFPCLLVLTLIDCAPLAPPEDGSRANYLFWARDFLTIALMTRVILEQFRISVPGLRINSFQVIAMPIISSGGAIAFMIAMSSVVGFPLPFALVEGILIWFVVLVVCFVLFFGRILKRDPVLLKDLLRSIVVLICQVLLTFVYPAYLYGFIRVEPSNQKFYVMLLPIIKIIAKNWISYCLGNKYDLIPQIMIFNVDVFNALYVSSSMQNSQSMLTVVQMVALDALLGWVSLSDISHLARDVLRLRRKIPAGHPLEKASFIEIALQIIEEDPHAGERLAMRRYSSSALVVRRSSGPSMIKLPVPPQLGTLSTTESAHTVALPTSGQFQPRPLSTTRQVLPVDLQPSTIPTAPEVKPLPLQLVPVQQSLDRVFSPKERQRFLERSARVLFTTEFVILVEYTEVIVPFIYSMYTTAMFYLPNRDYYPQLRSFDDAGLASNLASVITFGFIELVSLLVMGFLIQRMLRISMLHLLSFVLDRSWRMVQANLFLWICYTIQNAVEHNGARRFQLRVQLAQRIGRRLFVTLHRGSFWGVMAAREVASPMATQLTSTSQLQDAARVLMQPQNSRRASKIPRVQAPTRIFLAEQKLVSDFGAEFFPFAAFSAVSASLTVLDVSFNELDDHFWGHWAAELQDAVWPALTTLNLANNQFSFQGLAVIAAFIARCPSLTQLDLSLNLFGGSASQIQPLIASLDAKDREPLQMLDMSCTGITDVCVSQLLETLFAKKIQNLYLRSNALTDEAAIALSKLLPQMSVEVLSLSGNTIGDCGAASLAFVIDQTRALQTLDLEQNQIEKAGITSFYHALNGMIAPFPLRYLHLGGNNFTSEPVLQQIHTMLHEKVIETHLTSGPSAAAVLTLSGSKVKRDILLECCLTDRYVRVVTTTLRSSPNWQVMEVLDLSGNEIGEKGAYDVGLFLALQHSLRVLNLSSNLITDKAILGLADGLEPNIKLQELLLDHNQITDAGAKQLYLKAFTANQQRRIRLSVGNPLTSECKVMLAAISQAHDLRKRFANEFVCQDKLEFSGKALRQYGAAAIAEELAATPASKCRYLDFSRNSLGDEGAQAVANLLRAYPGLEELDVSFNDIGDEGAIALADALAENSTLTSFSLHSVLEGSQKKPKLQEKGLCYLARAIQTHKALAKLDLRNNVTPPAVIRAYVEMLRRNQGIQKFNGTSAAVFLSRYEE
ncbi:hypothetical protein PHYPSEUDO_010155 [Phytophthora pseudosyringae]|uniref:RNI-like protein n=1 Tax=Phytophthora pseudosyringae TaxID=221518 RepID=A0A8T1VFW2_9STRA|nr:hypothetical protein PHYPSEUDO_010155 [Phytophthora pseudosyringae]